MMSDPRLNRYLTHTLSALRQIFLPRRMAMKRVRISLMLLTLVLVIGGGTLSPSDQNGVQTKANPEWPTCPPICSP